MVISDQTFYLPKVNHRLRGSASTVLTATGSQWETTNFDPLQNRNRWADCHKIPHNWLCPPENPLNKIWYKSIYWGLLEKWVKYNIFVLFYLYLFFWDSRTGHTGCWIFTRDSSKDVKSHKDVLLGDLNDVPLNFGGKTPKTKILGAWILNRTFKPEWQKIQILITLKTT